ncbi:hypothetical protein FOS14_12045 [Skermania sp. ID1734]|uniref:hypothetical protein n=1 Tax=Skermania sp. ID1734 TaxID=2597516 RepID=UPI00117E4E97|nr:hypothetical protein [Skermania sp. ID1734]TSD99504.1 hypothetical protein FOS14_12045 [Skermania sp. ID1734]
MNTRTLRTSGALSVLTVAALGAAVAPAAADPAPAPDPVAAANSVVAPAAGQLNALLEPVLSLVGAPSPTGAPVVKQAAAVATVPGTNPADAPDPRFKTWSDREQWEFTRMKDTVATGATAGAAGGAVAAGATGCVLGAVTAGVATAPLLALLGAGPLAGCVAGAALLAPVGAIGGAVVVGAPTAAIAIGNYVYQSQIKPFTPPPAAK